LRRILGFADLLRDDPVNHEATDCLGFIHNIRYSAERMTELIDALLGLARFSRIKLTRKPVDLSAVVRRIAGELCQADPDRQVEFVIAEGVSADADEPLVLVVLENLLANAWKFTARTPAARIEFGVEPAAGHSPAYFVRDNGAGFDMDHADRMFLAFQRLHSEKDFPGIGIGLATVQRIIHRHGGRVWAQGLVGTGATFHFTLGESQLSL
jgi:light-regulated signal transduction histidine kinase (bacteriophytochrome)